MKHIVFIGLFVFVLACQQQPTENGFNLALSQKFGRLMAADQRVRVYLDSVGAAKGMDSEEYRLAVEKMKVQDALNLKEVSHLLDSCGWLGADKIGDDGQMDLFLAIQHADTSAMVKYLPLLRKAVSDKLAESSSLALMEDRVNVSRNLPQRYGSQIYYNQNEKRYQLYPLEDSMNVDQLRAEMQLQPLATYVAKWNIVWPPKN